MVLVFGFVSLEAWREVATLERCTVCRLTWGLWAPVYLLLQLFQNLGYIVKPPVSSEGHLCHQDRRWWEGMWALVCLWGFLLHVQLFFQILHPASLSDFRPTTRCRSNGHSRLVHQLSHCTRSSPCNKSLIPCHSWGSSSRSHQTQKTFLTVGCTAP